MWIHEYQNWTDFKWDAELLASKLADVRHRQGLLLGRLKGLGFELRREASLITLTNDVVKSSIIEGETLNPEEVRSSISRKLGIDIAGLVSSRRNVDGIVEMMLDATQNFSKPLTKDRLFDWHTALFPKVRSGSHKMTVGNWRTVEASPMQIVSGAIGNEKIHFEAPHAERLEAEMQTFLNWFNTHDTIDTIDAINTIDATNPVDPVIKAGIAHLWFVTIHPFEDGNGRIARAIGDMALARADVTQDRFYSLSSQIEAERKHYYDQLEKQQRSTPNITDWLSWFLDCFGRSIRHAETTLKNVLNKAKLWEIINQKPLHDRQRLVINRMLEDDFKGHMNTSKYAKIAKCSNDTALRDIQELKEKKILIQNPSGGRSTSYRLLKLGD